MVLLSLTGLIDLGVIPAALGDDELGPGFAVIALVLGLASIAAAIGLARGARWARPLGIVDRAVDGLAAAPGVFAGDLWSVVAGLVVVLSVAAIVLLVRMRTHRRSPQPPA